MSDLALQLIAENKRTQATFLDLGNCGLSEVPAEVGELDWIESLSFADEWYEYDGEQWQKRKSLNRGDANEELKAIRPLSGLIRLRSLSLSGTAVADLTPLAGLSALQSLDLSGTQVVGLTPLAGLTALRSLDLSDTEVEDLAPLVGLSALQALDLSNTQVADLAPLAGLSVLQTLDLALTSVNDVTPLAGLSALHTLDLSDTDVEDVTPLVGLSALQALDLSDTQVADVMPLAGLSTLQALHLPGSEVEDVAPLARLLALQALDLAFTSVNDVRPLADLLALQALDLSDTQVADAAPLAGLLALQALDLSDTWVTEVAPLAGLSALQSLGLAGTKVADVSALAGLSALQRLDLSGTQVVDAAPLADLSALRSLNLAGTQTVDVTPLAGLLTLQRLDLSRTPVADATPLAGLLALRTLVLSHTRVADLVALVPMIARGIAVHWSTEDLKGSGIYVEDCPLTSPPPEIAKQGAEAVLNYFREREAGEIDHLYEAKLLILGEGGAGKTSLLRRLYQPDLPLPTEQETTRGISIHRHEFTHNSGRPFRLNVWDFGGQQIYHATHQFFLTHRSLYLLVDDTKNKCQSVSDEGFKYWLEAMDSFGGHSPVLIFQNEKGGRSKAIDLAGIKGRFDNVREAYAGNLEDVHAADRLRGAIEFHAGNLSHIGEELPARWIQVRQDIEARSAGAPYIPQEAYFEIYRRHMPFDRTKALHLSRYLHDLGVFLHFQDDPLLTRTVILQNEWATDAVLRILDDEKVKARFGRFQAADCARIWHDSVYRDMHPELLALMQNFELCYELRDSDPRTWLATQLLPPSKPKALAAWNQPDDLVLRYRYDFLPQGVISRLTVRLHRYVLNPGMAWVTGVLFESDGAQVLVELMPNGSEIELRARGQRRKPLLSVVAADLDALNASFQGLRDKLDKLIPCNCEECRATAKPEFYSEKHLLRRKEAGRLKVECPSSFEAVSVLELLDGIRIDGDSKPLRIIRIFLASSEELREDRDEFDLYFRQQNDELRKRGVYLEVVRWENFLDAMSETRMQDEYNAEVRACDVFVALFFTKTGRFTEEEFDVAYRWFQERGKPLIYTFFKDAEIRTGNARIEDLVSLDAFKKKLKDRGHFPTTYRDAEHLKLLFRDQLDKILARDAPSRAATRASTP